jgi:hypothetical protein
LQGAALGDGAGVVVTPREAAWMEQSRENDMPTGPCHRRLESNR